MTNDITHHPITQDELNAMNPQYSLSEILRRRASFLHTKIRKANEYDTNTARDIVLACGEEIKSIEYWMRIAEEAERETRMSSLLEDVINIVQKHDERRAV